MESLSQNELISTIVNLSKKVEDLKMQNEHLKKIRLQLASLAINNNFSNDVTNVSKSSRYSLSEGIIPKTKSSFCSQLIEDDKLSMSDLLIPKFKSFKNIYQKNGIVRKSTDESIEDIIIDESDEDNLVLNLQNRQIRIHDAVFELELFTNVMRVGLFADLRVDSTHYYRTDLHFQQFFLPSSYFSRSIERPFLCMFFKYAPASIKYFSYISDMTLAIPVLNFTQRTQSVYFDEHLDNKKMYFHLKYQSGIRCLTWNFRDKLVDIDAISRRISEQTHSYDDYTNYFQACIKRSHLGHCLSVQDDSNFTNHPFTLKIPVKENIYSLTYQNSMKYQRKSIKSYTVNVPKSHEVQPLNQLNDKNTRKNIYLRNETLLFNQKRNAIETKSDDEISNTFDDVSQTPSGTNQRGVLLNSSRKVWYEKCQMSYAILMNKALSEIIFFTEFSISVSPKHIFEFIFGNSKSRMEKRKNRIIQSQLSYNDDDRCASKVDEKSDATDDFIHLKSLDHFEATFPKSKFHSNNYQDRKNIYEMKNIIKSNLILNVDRRSNVSPLNSLSFSNHQECNIDNSISHQSKVSSKTLDSLSDSTATTVQPYPHTFHKYNDSVFEDHSLRKRTSSYCDTLGFPDFEQDTSTFNSRSEKVFHEELKNCPNVSLKSLKPYQKAKHLKAVHANTYRENSKPCKNRSRQSNLSYQRKSITVSENDGNDQSDKEIKERRDKIHMLSRLSFIKHLTELSKGENVTKVNTLRRKAASYILNSKMSYSSWEKNTGSSTSVQIKHFLDNEVHDMITHKHYNCDTCCIKFKLGTELRQHLRKHNLRKKSCVI